MNGAGHAGPDELLERLAAIVDIVDPPPPQVAAAARDAFALRSIEAELAELVYDSWLDDRALAGVRTSSGPRRLTFDAPELTLEVQVDVADGRTCQLVGQVVPPRPGIVEVRHAERSLSVSVDRLGRFSVERLPPGHISLRCRAEGAPPVDTAWVVVC